MHQAESRIDVEDIFTAILNRLDASRTNAADSDRDAGQGAAAPSESAGSTTGFGSGGDSRPRALEELGGSKTLAPSLTDSAGVQNTI